MRGASAAASGFAVLRMRKPVLPIAARVFPSG